MVSLIFALCLTFLSLWRIANLQLSSNVRQESGFVSAEVGGDVTLRCFYEGDVAAMFYWYKQSFGQKPQLISTFYKHDENATFYEEFKDNPRFSLETKNGKNHLTITDLHLSDSATYHCMTCYAYKFEFAEGITVSVKGSGVNIKASVHQSESIQPGGSVTLNCTVHTETCDGEHRVYWFKDSEESHPGLIYTNGGSNDQCERKPNTQTHTCVYNLPMKSLNPSHAGIYYCAVASCGRILFGNGTKLKIAGEVNSPSVLVHFLSGALAFTTILSVFMAVLLHKMKKKNGCQCTESRTRCSDHSTANAQVYQEADDLHYSALSKQTLNRSRRQRDDALNQCVYSSVRH
ncbi:uncharacterized protein [Embiotoca jacksoni]|uniref:uncharacterized protein n=1 Tax=Embiotoca jacksoni TaxID=100190 RepID=UPI0037049B59